MEKMIIPFSPESLDLSITNSWDGKPSAEHHHARVSIAQSDVGIVITGVAKLPLHDRAPQAPQGTRVDGLWDYDVVEVFLVGADGHYLEVELGARGHWLVFGFNGIRNRSNEYMDFKPTFTYTTPSEDMWQSSITIPWDMVPQQLARMNAFAISDNNFLALNPVPGEAVDFHQPNTYPLVELAQRA